jgi:hypothetical protein
MMDDAGEVASVDLDLVLTVRRRTEDVWNS